MSAKAFNNIVETVFNTPLVKINHMLPHGAATVYVKCEFFNPMASVKDRIGRAMIEVAEQDGTINSGTHIIEPTSGNTGIALAFVCAAKGYKITLTMPESMSLERRALLKGLGASLILTPAAGGMKAAIEKAAELVAAEDNAWMPQQFENPANPAIHETTTGPEIWEATDGKVDILVAGVGTGGTISGAGKFLKSKNPNIKCIAVEPVDSPVIAQTRNGEDVKPGPHKIQGIGAGFIPLTSTWTSSTASKLSQTMTPLQPHENSAKAKASSAASLQAPTSSQHPRSRKTRKCRQNNRRYRTFIRRTLHLNTTLRTRLI